MGVSAAIFSMQDAGAFLVLNREFAFEVTQKCADDFGAVVTDVRVNMNVPDRAVSPPVAGTEDKLTQLPGQIVGGQVAGCDKLHVLTSFSREKVPRESRTALSPGLTGKHLTAASQ